MNFDYTQVYRDIYDVIKNDNIPHEEAHKASISIANAISDIYLFSMQYPIEIHGVISDAIEKIINK